MVTLNISKDKKKTHTHTHAHQLCRSTTVWQHQQAITP